MVILLTLIIGYVISVLLTYFAFKKAVEKDIVDAKISLVMMMFIPIANIVWSVCALSDAGVFKSFAERLFGVK